MKGNEKAKGRWPPKQEIPKDVGEEESVVPYNKFSTTRKGLGEQHTRGDDRAPLQCWICGKDHRKMDFPQYQGGRTHIYSAQEAQKIGDVGHNIPWTYVVMDSRKEDH